MNTISPTNFIEIQFSHLSTVLHITCWRFGPELVHSKVVCILTLRYYFNDTFEKFWNLKKLKILSRYKRYFLAYRYAPYIIIFSIILIGWFCSRRSILVTPGPDFRFQIIGAALSRTQATSTTLTRFKYSKKFPTKRRIRRSGLNGLCRNVSPNLDERQRQRSRTQCNRM